MTRLVFAAFLRRDCLNHLSYRLEFGLDLASIVFSVATFYFVASLFGPAAAPALAAYGGDYFPFVVIGLAFSAYQSAGLHSLGRGLRTEQYLGTLEALLSTPAPAPLLLLASAQWDFWYATLQMLLYLGLAWAVFGLGFPHAAFGSALLVGALTVAAFVSLGMLSASFIMRFKQGDPVAWFLAAASELLGGVYFPVAILPDWLRPVSALLPMTHSLEGLRLSLLKGAGLWEVRGPAAALAAFTAVFLPLGLWLLCRSVDAARREGTLAHY